MRFLQNVQIITPALIINKENFNLSLKPNSGKSDPPALLERERQTNVMKPGSWKKMHWLMENNNLHCIFFFFFQAHLSFYQQPKHKAKVKVQPLLCSFPPGSTLPARGGSAALGSVSPGRWVPLQPGCFHCLRLMCFSKKTAAAAVTFQVMLGPAGADRMLTESWIMPRILGNYIWHLCSFLSVEW